MTGGISRLLATPAVVARVVPIAGTLVEAAVGRAGFAGRARVSGVRSCVTRRLVAGVT
jgi:hypothetical protein